MVVPRRSFGLLLGTLTLFFAAFAYAVPGNDVCPQPFLDDSDARPSVIQPLQPAERLMYGIDRYPGGMLEVRYHVNGKLHLTEVIDLDTLALPLTREPKGLMRQKDVGGDREGAAGPRQDAIHGVRVIELLTLEPDAVRELHALARQGAVIDIELLWGGAPIEKLSFAELALRSAEMAKKLVIPMFAQTTVSGPGVDSPARTSRVATNEYLESCSECTYDHPCDTECGYDPGKGGPVTCGEYGAPCGGEPTCPSSYTSGEWWGPWTYYSTGYGWTQCVMNSFGSGDRYQERITTYRRERIRRTTTCPNSPSCTGCYDTEAVISVQYSQSVCWEDTFFGCSFPETACCWRANKCTGFFSPCSNGFGCW
ncbi:MAG TPA: hypothetical protein VGD79_11865 [Thermoanaerobaculia bacterium]